MFFESGEFTARIFAIDRVSWEAWHRYVRPRPFGALVLRVRGQGSFSFDGGKRLQSTEGDVMYVPHGVGYDADHTDGEIIAIHFWESGTIGSAENYTPCNGCTLMELFCAAEQTFSDGSIAARMEANAMFYRILSALCERDGQREIENPAFLHALSLLLEGYADADISIASVCTRAGISESAFRRNFYVRYGKSPVKYLTEIRLRAAQRRLANGTETVEAVALSCGFRDVKYFSRVVKHCLGCTPTELRSI